MIEKIADLPDNVLGFSAKGKLTMNDYETIIIPAVEDLFSRKKKVRQCISFCFYSIHRAKSELLSDA